MEMTKKMKMAAVGAAAVAVVGGGVFAYTRLAGGDPKETVIQAFEMFIQRDRPTLWRNCLACRSLRMAQGFCQPEIRADVKAGQLL